MLCTKIQTVRVVLNLFRSYFGHVTVIPATTDVFQPPTKLVGVNVGAENRTSMIISCLINLKRYDLVQKLIEDTLCKSKK